MRKTRGMFIMPTFRNRIRIVRLVSASSVFAAACAEPTTLPDSDGAACASSSGGICGAAGAGGAGSFAGQPGGGRSLDLTRYPTSVGWAFWLTPPDVSGSPFDRRWPHLVGNLSTPPDVLDGDLTICTLSVVSALPDGRSVDFGVVVDSDNGGADAVAQD